MVRLSTSADFRGGSTEGINELGKEMLSIMRERKDKMLHNVNTGQRELMEGGYSVVFKPSRKLKSYFKAYGKGKKQTWEGKEET